METYTYRCPVCGFIYFVPSYWMSYSPEAETEFPHQNVDTGEDCPNLKLEYMGEG